MHDFYLEAWDGLLRRFDPSKGRLTTYVYMAFYRFARRRIVHWQRWHAPLRALRDVDKEVGHSADSSKDPDADLRLKAVQVGLSRLPPLEGAVLYDFLTGSRSERELAARHGLSRYRIRRALVDALDQLMATIGDQPWTDPADRPSAVLLWGSGRSARDSATQLGLPLTTVQAARRRWIQTLLKQLRSLPSPR